MGEPTPQPVPKPSSPFRGMGAGEGGTPLAENNRNKPELKTSEMDAGAKHQQKILDQESIDSKLEELLCGKQDKKPKLGPEGIKRGLGPDYLPDSDKPQSAFGFLRFDEMRVEKGDRPHTWGRKRRRTNTWGIPSPTVDSIEVLLNHRSVNNIGVLLQGSSMALLLQPFASFSDLDLFLRREIYEKSFGIGKKTSRIKVGGIALEGPKTMGFQLIPPKSSGDSKGSLSWKSQISSLCEIQTEIVYEYAAEDSKPSFCTFRCAEKPVVPASGGVISFVSNPETPKSEPSLDEKILAVKKTKKRGWDASALRNGNGNGNTKAGPPAAYTNRLLAPSLRRHAFLNPVPSPDFSSSSSSSLFDPSLRRTASAKAAVSSTQLSLAWSSPSSSSSSPPPSPPDSSSSNGKQKPKFAVPSPLSKSSTPSTNRPVDSLSPPSSPFSLSSSTPSSGHSQHHSNEPSSPFVTPSRPSSRSSSSPPTLNPSSSPPSSSQMDDLWSEISSFLLDREGSVCIGRGAAPYSWITAADDGGSVVDGSEFSDVNAALSSLNKQLKKARKGSSGNLRHMKESSKWKFVEGKDFDFTGSFSNISRFVGQRQKKKWIEINLPGQSFIVARSGQKGKVVWQSGSRRYSRLHAALVVLDAHIESLV